MTRLIIVVFLAAAVITLASIEQVVIGRAYGRLERDVNAMVDRLNMGDKEGKVDTPENISQINHMYDYWLQYERRLSMLARHFDLAQVSTNLIYAKNFIEFDNKEEAMVGLLQVRYLIKTHRFNVGTSIQNVI